MNTYPTAGQHPVALATARKAAPARGAVKSAKSPVKSASRGAAQPKRPAASPAKAATQARPSPKPAAPGKTTVPAAKGNGAALPNGAVAMANASESKPNKPKLVRDSFTMPKAEYQVIDQLKRRSAQLARPAKKSELLRAGLKALVAMDDAAFAAAIHAVPVIKTGRPKSKKLAEHTPLE
jgi:hypothetical protein